jgi:hypothetical protein
MPRYAIASELLLEPAEFSGHRLDALGAHLDRKHGKR